MGKHHDSNLIFTLVSGITNEFIKMKCPNGFVLVKLQFDQRGQLLPPSDEDKLLIGSARGRVCAYLHGHGGELNGKKLSVFQNEKQQRVFYQQLANMFFSHLKKSHVTELDVKTYLCYADASTSRRKRDSYSRGIYRELKLIGFKKIRLITSPHMFTIDIHPTTRKIFTYLGTEVEVGIRRKFKEEQMGLLEGVKWEFQWNHFGSLGLSPKQQNEIGAYSVTHLLPERLKTPKQIEEFICELCEFLLHKMFLLDSFERPLVEMVFALIVMKEYLIKNSMTKQEIIFNKALRALKQANYDRPYAKVLLTWDGKKDKKVDYYSDFKPRRNLGK